MEGEFGEIDVVDVEVGVEPVEGVEVFFCV